MNFKGAYIEAGATANDIEDGVLTKSIVITGSDQIDTNLLGIYYVQYSITDSDDNTTTIEREVRVEDNTAPSITLTGSSTITIEAGNPYSELGAVATDNYDNSVNVIIGGDTVDASTLGTYVVTYDQVMQQETQLLKKRVLSLLKILLLR